LSNSENNKFATAVVSRGKALSFLAASHEDPKHPGAIKKVLFDSSTLPSGKVQMVNWARVPAAKGFQSHYHEDMHEVFIIVSGRGEMTVNSESVVLESGDAILVPPRTLHSMNALDGNDLDYVVFGVSSGENGKTVVTSSELG